MQGPTHFVTGILIQRSMSGVKCVPLRYFLIAFLAYISHGVLDRLAKVTYHPSSPLPHDAFWVFYHVIIALLSLYIFLRFFREYKVGLIFSVFPDIDWIVLYLSGVFSVELPFWKKPILHGSLFWFVDIFLPSGFIDSLPAWGLQKRGAIIEFVLLGLLFSLVHILRKRALKPEEK